MAKFTIILRRCPGLMEMLDDDCEFYVANADRDFPNLKVAVAWARREVARVDTGDLNERREGVHFDKVDPSRDNYVVVTAFEGRPTILAYPGVTLTEIL